MTSVEPRNEESAKVEEEEEEERVRDNAEVCDPRENAATATGDQDDGGNFVVRGTDGDRGGGGRESRKWTEEGTEWLVWMTPLK